ncbi:protein of unknown function [Tenacibaculum aestuariivivum]
MKSLYNIQKKVIKKIKNTNILTIKKQSLKKMINLFYFIYI